MSGFYGQSIQKITRDEIDRDGVRRVAISQKWRPSHSGMSASEILAERPAVPDIGDGFSLVLPIVTEPNPGYYETTWNFEGESGGIDGTQPKDRENSTDWNFRPVFGEKSLVLHADWWDLQKEFGGWFDDAAGRIIWPEWKPKSGYERGRETGEQTDQHSEMYGRQTFFDLTGGIYTFRYAQNIRPNGLYDGIGTIFQRGKLPGNPPPFRNRDWLKCQPNEDSAGANMFRFEEIYWLSEEGGWPSKIYPKS